MSTDERRLDDTTVTVLIAPEDTQQVEFTDTRQAVADAGATVDAVGSDAGEAQAVNDDLEEDETFEGRPHLLRRFRRGLRRS